MIIIHLHHSRTAQEDRLLISDPKALQYIFHTSGECYLLVELYNSGLASRIWFSKMAREDRNISRIDGAWASLGRRQVVFSVFLAFHSDRS